MVKNCARCGVHDPWELNGNEFSLCPIINLSELNSFYESESFNHCRNRFQFMINHEHVSLHSRKNSKVLFILPTTSIILISAVFNPYWQIMENSSKNFSKIFIFRVVTQAVLLVNSSIKNHEFFSVLGRHTGRFIGKLIHWNFWTEIIYDMVWMRFPVKRSSPRPGSSKTASETSQKFANKGWKTEIFYFLSISF